ncbi:MAG: sulfatase [Planctomycetes bacterium]|nr:sulfatase [Planctomycetota bacterium]
MILRCILTLLALFSFARLSTAVERPNFVWLISEDNSTHYLKLYNEHGAETSRIAQLAKHGLLFEHAFSNSPVCSVARTTLISGCYGPRIGTQYHRRSVTVPLPDGLQMFPAYLRQAGYYAANNNKKDYNAVEGDGVWDISSTKASWRQRKAGQPFFYKQSFKTTHESSLHFSEKVMRNEATKTDPDSVFVAPYHPDTPTFRYTYARYHDRIQSVDQQIGQVVDRLDTDGLLEDTFIFYFGDHGGVLPRGKGYAYESGLHVPLVVRVPENWKHLVDAEVDTRVPGFVSFIDFGPTVLHLAGIDVPDAVDGRPFLGKGVKFAEVNQRDEAFGYADRFDEKYDLVRTLRKGKYEYVRSYQPFNFDGLQNNYRYRMLAYVEWRALYNAGKLNDVQRQFFETRPAEALYDIDTDPYETNNLATDPAFAEVTRDMRNRLSQLVKGLPDLSMYPESYLVDHAFGNPVSFGQAHKTDIAKLVDVADLSLLSFEDASRPIEQMLASDDPWQRYWALIACSSHGDAARPLVGMAKDLAANDTKLLVRVRAAEFLGLVGAARPQSTIMSCLEQTISPVEANLILNTLVLLRDGTPGYDFDVNLDQLKSLKEKKADGVQRRMEYLASP